MADTAQKSAFFSTGFAEYMAEVVFVKNAPAVSKIAIVSAQLGATCAWQKRKKNAIVSALPGATCAWVQGSGFGRAELRAFVSVKVHDCCFWCI
jgi:hypothetical protein